MVEHALLMDVAIIALLIAMIGRSHFKSEEVHDRLDDVIDGVGLFATEVLKRTESLMEMGRSMAPAIELHNHNPLEQIFKFLQGMKTGNFPDDNITNPRDSHGRYGPREEQTENTTPEVIDISD